MTIQNEAFCQSYGCLDLNQNLSEGGSHESPFQSSKHRSTPNLLALSKSQMERIQIISEFHDGEEVLVSDLKTVVKVYKYPLEKLGILTSTEINNLFYSIEAIIPVFEGLANSLSSEVNKYFSIPCIGMILYLWLGLEVITKPQPDYLNYGRRCYPYPTQNYVQSICESYIEMMPSSIKLLLDYSAHLYEARKYFEALREQKPAFTDFLSRCSHTHFSKRLDLWHFLECPKSRLTRYPLLLNRLIELTPSTDPELSHLLVVRSAFTFIIDELNRRVGEAMRNLYLKCIGFHGNLELQYKDMVCHQKSLLLKGNLHTDIGEVAVFVFPQLMLITISSEPDNNSRLISRCYYGKLSRQIIKSHVTTSSKNSPTSLVPPLSSIICSENTRVYSHRWSLLSILRTRSPSDSGNVTHIPFNSGNRPSKYARLFRRLSSIMTSSSTKLDISRPTATTSFTPADETVSLERFRICYPPLILKDYILEDISDDSIPSTILKFPFSAEKAHQNLFKLSPYEHSVKRKSGRTSAKQSDLLHSHEKIISRTSRETKWFSSSSLTSNKTSSLLRKSRKTISREFLFQASSLQDKKFWITTLTPLVRSYYQRESCNDLVLV
ncbi:unnamed protein product [Schistosoma margrebowiei]|uniref:DH domain-containing protein n=2 Tax=Schistosoma margrebowiei TaxID=48269 RepID=A0AA85AC79_9TREM|nr:unnamed protein product [Schistosoma margrebowiei]